MTKILKEPLLHFLLMGLLLFVLYYQLNPETEDDDVIVLNEESILTFVQYRTKSFEPKLAKQRWAKMSKKEQQYLLNEYVKEEVLYREALALGLDQDDYIIKRRLVQKVDFTLQAEPSELPVPSDAQLQQLIDQNPEDYWVEAATTFTHVYLKDASIDEAKKLLSELNAKQVPFSSAAQYGQRFLYHLNYVERTQAYIEAHFGTSFSDSLFAVPADHITDQWLGPFQSQHGVHLLMVTELTAGHQPSLTEIRPRLEQDYRQQQQQQQALKKLQQLKQKYQVKKDMKWSQTEALN